MCHILNNSYYINLEKRKERKEHVEKELKKINVHSHVRIDAIEHN